MRTLYEIKKDCVALLDIAADPEMDPQVVADTLEAVQGELSVKADNLVTVIEALKAEEEMLDHEIERLTARKNTISNNIKSIKTAIKDAMIATGQEKMPTEHYKLSVAKNGGKQALDVYGEVPDKYMKMIYQPDTDRIRKALEAGEQLDFAVLSERGTHLHIR